jgi:hypothetical protein
MRNIFYSLTLILILFVFPVILIPLDRSRREEVTKGPHEARHVPQNQTEDQLEYERYLKEVFEELSNDHNFAQVLEKIDRSNIKPSEIARHLSLVRHGIRTRLDEIKRREIDRLVDLHHRLDKVEHPQEPGQRANVFRMNTRHLDLENFEGFGENDLHKLIERTVSDLKESDKRRRENFKRYEMHKELELKEKMEAIHDEKKLQGIKQHLEEDLKQRQHHEPVHHPGKKEQLEEVWTDVDKLPINQFDAKTFFSLHDLNSDGYLDPTEIETIMTHEANKVYPLKNESIGLAGGVKGDPMERAEEIARMREEALREMDQDNDLLVSASEFNRWTHSSQFQDVPVEDDDWLTIEDKKQFTDDDLKAYKPRFEEIEAHEKFDVTPIPRAEPEFPKDHTPAPGHKPDDADLLYAENSRDYLEYEDYADKDDITPDATDEHPDYAEHQPTEHKAGEAPHPDAGHPAAGEHAPNQQNAGHPPAHDAEAGAHPAGAVPPHEGQAHPANPYAAHLGGNQL